MQQEQPSSGQPGDISQLADHLFRREAGKLVSILTGIFGIERLQLAEDVVQEALIRALQTWPYYGVPKNPAAWLTQTAKNQALDVIRREKNFREKEPRIISFIEQWGHNDDQASDGEFADERLRLTFVCCHPEIPAESQVALALKTLCAFSPAEIAKAFLTTEAAIAKRLTRARQRIRELKVRFEIPEGEEIPGRLESVLQTIYLFFNEGYKASSGDSLIREDLCHEAIRLATLLLTHRVGNQPRVHALAALMHFNAARLPARMDSLGNILRLEEQDRGKWDKKLIGRGVFHLSQSARGDELSTYHLQAGIAAVHCLAKDYQATDWPQILSLYDRLIEIEDTPVVALNRAVAVARIHGPDAGLRAVDGIKDQQPLESYYLRYAVLAEFELQRNNLHAAADHLRQALKFTEVRSERDFLSKRLARCTVEA